ncbi:glycosyltransferase family 2 protein [Halobacteriovorax sp. HLS]|uniref:glycosyltransferase family 2 protein n=1 Tax=Halobacteriovorax sp. HLS TaxID=2234000 RepID=UPI000FDCA934|nr:glycosyltransferase family 2 protein [Halobacteriovorax sp. HLS]
MKVFDLSIVIPIYNEEDNIADLYQEIVEALSGENISYEIIFVNDGSKDKSEEIINEIGAKNPIVKGLHFKRNFGQTAAMAAGIEAGTGNLLGFLDGDRQNDPNDIPSMLKEFSNGYDVVVGWRKNRQDAVVSRKIPSKIANYLIRRIGKVEVHDLGCTLKIFKRELIQDIKLYGEMHRFIPLYAEAAGGRIKEVVVNHRARVAGETKYGISRTFKVILDLIVVKFLLHYSTRPMHFFGIFSFSFFLMTVGCSFALMLHMYLHKISMIQSPLLVLSSVFLSLSVNSILLGLISELLMRTYFSGNEKTSYNIKERVNF